MKSAHERTRHASPTPSLSGFASVAASLLLITFSSTFSANADTTEATESLEDGSLSSPIAVGDFNGDGHLDTATGYPTAILGTLPGAGVVTIQLGAPATAGEGANLNQRLHSRSPGFPDPSSVGDDLGRSKIPGRAAVDEAFGQAIAVGDFDADGFDDLAIGVPGQKIRGHEAAGAVLVAYGSHSGSFGVSVQSWHQNVGWLPDHAETDDRFGAALAVGDFDDDGFSDLAIGVPGEDSPAPNRIEDAGAVQVIYGTPAGLRSRKNQFLTQSWTGMQNAPHAFDRFGSALTAKDFDAKPGTDLAVVVPGEDLGPGYDAGAISVIFGSAVRGLSEAGNQLVHHSAMPIEVIAAEATSNALDTVMHRLGDDTPEAVFELPPPSPSEDYAQRLP